MLAARALEIALALADSSPTAIQSGLASFTRCEDWPGIRRRNRPHGP